MRRLRRATREASRDQRLGRNVMRATESSLAHRRTVVEERPDWEALRARATALRAHVLTHLDAYLEQFRRAAEARGAVVHVAEDATAARRIVTDLARDVGARHVLKSKSMTTEEIDLNRALEDAAITPLETDLGEYIVQLAGEPPSHITAPALHRSAEQIAELFAEHDVLRASVPEDRAELATWLSLQARDHLRPLLLDADMGISGANFLIAESGTVVLVENEGNIRYTTTSPRVQVALVGIEKLLPTLSDLATCLPLLTRSATGQRATTYTTLISGPLRDALHIVLLDGGRTRMLRRDDDRELLQCIRCGACMNVCPVYRTVGGHAYGSPYPGPIGAALTPALRGTDDDADLPWASSLCGACTAICPVGIDLHGQLLRARARQVEGGKRSRAEALLFALWRWAMGGRRRYTIATRLARVLQGVTRRAGPLGAWCVDREAPRFAASSFRARWRQREASR